MNHAEGEIRDLEDGSGGEPNSHGDHGSAGVGELGLRSEDPAERVGGGGREQ